MKCFRILQPDAIKSLYLLLQIMLNIREEKKLRKKGKKMFKNLFLTSSSLCVFTISFQITLVFSRYTSCFFRSERITND